MWTKLSFILLLISSVVFARGGYKSSKPSYPTSHGYSGTGTGYHNPSNYGHKSPASPGHNYPVSPGHNYPASPGHNYPASPGLSGNNQVPPRNQHYPRQEYGHKTEVHHHYHYRPPTQIVHGSVAYPVYHGPPPVYVYQYRDSGSRFDNLLTGLALYNLGRMSASHHTGYPTEYRGYPGESCKLGISKPNGDYEETRIQCQLMSSFIWEAERQATQVVSNTVVNNINVNGNTVTTNTVVRDALEVKGPSLQVTQGMQCFLIRTGTSYLRKNIDCGLLQTYAISSMHVNSAVRLMPALYLIFALIVSTLY